MAGFTYHELISVLSRAHVEHPGSCRVFRHVTIDSRAVKKTSIFVAIRGVNLDGHDFVSNAVANGARCVIVEKKLRMPLPENMCVIRVADTTHALGELARAHRQRFSIPVIAVTGSAGKTTTKDMIAGVLKRKFCVLKNQGSFNNHWGVPLTLLQLSQRHQVAVIEIGTNHPGEIAYLARIANPTVVVLTNIGPSHLEGFHSLENVYLEKRSLIDGLVTPGAVIFNRDDPFLRRLSRLRCPHYSFGVRTAADFIASDLHLDKNAWLTFQINGRYSIRMRTPVRENAFNALAAVACARMLNISFSEICCGLEQLRFQKNRQQIERVNGVTLINDSYNANPLSFRSSLNTLKDIPAHGRKILVCGDMLELGKDAAKLHREIGLLAADDNIDSVLAYGPLMKQCVQVFVRANRSGQAKHYCQISALNRSLMQQVRPGDVILVKGSRGMRMERVVNFLKEHFEKR